MGVVLGVDVGSTTVKVVAIDRDHALLAETYRRANGRPRPTLLRALQQLLRDLGRPTIDLLGITGSGGGPIASLLGVRHVNELIAQTRAVAEYHPDARTVIEMGGQDSKLLSLERNPSTGEVRLVDFAMNALCAAGTGAFLDQQAERLGISIEDEFAALALQSRTPARIAGRCTVFAKSDMIHLQQHGTSLPDILAGLCLALARNFRAVIGKGKSFAPPILFQGGVAHNRAVVRGFETVLDLSEGAIIVPRHHPIMAALGAAFVALDEDCRGDGRTFHGLDPLEEVVRTGAANSETLPPLVQLTTRSRNGKGHASPTNGRRTPAYIGIDVGSVSTCVAVLDEQGRLLARRYLMTAGRPLEAVRDALLQIGAEVGDRVEVRGVGATGSGRYLTGHFVGADVVRNEITAQARAAVAADADVDTVFEIGGQDSKYIRIQHGAVVDFAMNHACAAGTGSFLQEQADRLRIDIAEDFARLALESPGPVALGERCTVFMESDLIHHQQQGKCVQDLTGGLAYSIVQNYLNRVLDGRAVGQRILFQGGVAWNDAVVAAFQQLLERPVAVPPDHDLTGAIGAALLAREERERSGPERRPPSRFRGFDLTRRTYESETFECRACPNLCQVNRVRIADEPPIFHGARCDRFEEAGRGRSARAELTDHFAERQALLMGGYTEPQPGTGRPRVGIPRVLVFYDLFPFWRTFFDALGFDVVLSEPTNPRLVRLAQEAAAAETCFPVKLAFGHALDVLEKGVDFLFLPSVINRENFRPGQINNQYCPFIPAVSHLITATIDLEARGVVPLKPSLEMSWVPPKRTQLRSLAEPLHVSRRRIVAAAEAGQATQDAFYAAVRRRGTEVLDALPADGRAVVLVGRPYNTADMGAIMDLPLKLRRLGVLPLPMDFLPVSEIDVSDRYPNMFWRSGQDILAAARLIRDDPRLLAIYVTNFNCGPDSFISGFFRRSMGRKPYLELELDDHTGEAGVITRCEAFLDSTR